ncbi:hypothetical protein ACWV95_20770 [Streptomyces albus]
MADQSLNLTNTKKAPSSKHTTKTGIPLDWSAPHGPLTGALSATTGAGATALLGRPGGCPRAGPWSSAPPARWATVSAPASAGS